MLYYNDNDRRHVRRTMEFPSLKNPSIGLDINKIDFIEVLFLKLHTIVRQQGEHERGSNQNISESISLRQFRKQTDKDESTLHRCITSLSCGKTLKVMRTDHELWIKRKRIGYVTADLLRSDSYKHPCLLQQAMNQASLIYGC